MIVVWRLTMNILDLLKIEDESERVNRTYDFFNEDVRLNRSKAARVEFLTTVFCIINLKSKQKKLTSLKSV
jgi:hypothetical protein